MAYRSGFIVSQQFNKNHKVITKRVTHFSGRCMTPLTRVIPENMSFSDAMEYKKFTAYYFDGYNRSKRVDGKGFPPLSHLFTGEEEQWNPCIIKMVSDTGHWSTLTDSEALKFINWFLQNSNVERENLIKYKRELKLKCLI